MIGEYLRMKCITAATLVVLFIFSPHAFAHKAAEEKVEALNSRVQRIERVVDNQALINLSKRIEAMQREVQELRGENERLNHELDTLKSRQREQYLDIDRRLQSGAVTGGEFGAAGSSNVNGTNNSLDNSNATSATAVPVPNNIPSSTGTTIDGAGQNVISGTGSATSTATNTSATVVGTASSNTNNAALDYKEAFTLLKLGKYGPSITSFEAFLQNHPGSKYAANAQYWLAEANYVSKKYPTALTEFSKVVEQYPASSKVADAKLKLGFTYYELGQYEQSRIELTRLRAQFPNSSVASLAQQRLERIAREGH